MKTPMQEMLEWVRATLPMDLDYPRMIEDKIESLLAKEEDVIIYAFLEGCESAPDDGRPISGKTWYNETFNTKEKQSANVERESQPTLHWDSLPTPNEINKRMKKKNEKI